MLATITIIACIWGILQAGPGVGWAGPSTNEVLLREALQNMQEENHEEALQQLQETWEKGPKTPEKAFLLGKVYRNLLKYREAQRYLEEAVSLKAAFPAAQLLLADTLIALDRVDEALPHLQQLQATGFEPTQTAYQLGLAYSKKKEYDQATEYFRQAQADPALAQDAKLQLGLALAGQEKLSEARRAIQDAISLDPKSPLSGMAQGYVMSLDRRLKETKPFRFQVTAGFDYDTNVTLNPGGAEGQQVSGQGDLVYTQTAVLEYNLIPKGPFALWAQYSYWQNFHRRITTYDLITHVAGLVPMYTFKNGRFWIPFNFNYTDVGSDKYYTAFLLTPSYLHLFTPKIGAEVALRLARQYYWTPPSFAQDARSGRNLGGSLALYYFLKNQQGYLMARFSYLRDSTTGSNWDSSSYFLNLSLLYPFTDRFKVRGFVEIGGQPYDHQWFSGDITQSFPKRSDKYFMSGLEFTQVIYKGLEANVHYYFVRGDSNIPLYDYKRHIMGGMLAYRY